MTDVSHPTSLRRAQWMDAVNALFGRFAVSPHTATEPSARFALSNCIGTLRQEHAADSPTDRIILLDISHTGVGFAIERPLAPGERATITFDALGEPAIAWAVDVVWCRRAATGEFHVGAIVSASRSAGRGGAPTVARA